MKDDYDPDDMFAIAAKRNAEKEAIARRKAVIKWLADHGIETLALIVAIIALIRTF